MVIDTAIALVVQSKLSEGFEMVTFRDPDGWEFSVAAFRGHVAPARVILSRFMIRLSGAPNDFRDFDTNLAEINELRLYCNLEPITDHHAIDQAIDRFFNQAKELGTSVQDFRAIIFDVLHSMEWGNVVEVDAIPTIFSRTKPDRVTPRRFSVWAYDRAAFPV